MPFNIQVILEISCFFGCLFIIFIIINYERNLKLEKNKVYKHILEQTISKSGYYITDEILEQIPLEVLQNLYKNLLNDALLKCDLQKLIDDNAFEIHTSEYGNLEVIDINAIKELF